MEFLEQEYLGNTVRLWLIALIIIIVSFIVIRIGKKFAVRLLKKWTARTKNFIDDFVVAIIEDSVIPVLYALGVYFALSTLTLPPKLVRVIYVAFLFFVTYYILRAITSAIRQFIHYFIKRRDNNTETKEKQARGLIIILNVVIWILGIVSLIDNLGYDVTTLIAGLGIGGIAIALAAQTILGDLFSYFVIFFDRPFEIGDFIIVEDKMGSVEYIGIKTTRLRSLSGEQIVFSNTYLTNSRVHNYKRMDTRRIEFNMSVSYEVPPEMVEKIPDMVKDIIKSKEKVQLDRGHFSGFGDSGLNFQFVYIVQGSDYNLYMDIQQSIYFDILKTFGNEKVKFAHPVREVYINTLPEQKQKTEPIA